jgi:hypothetical protein
MAPPGILPVREELRSGPLQDFHRPEERIRSLEDLQPQSERKVGAGCKKSSDILRRLR